MRYGFWIRKERNLVGLSANLSLISDWMCGPIVAQTASKYSRFIHTPEHFVEMLFLVEDKRFPIHIGVDPIAIIRAALSNLQGHGFRQGASTIVQQVYTIQMSRSQQIPRSIEYKFRQIGWSLARSVVRGKRAILRQYIETVYWGRNYRGLDRAVEGYFSGSRTSLSAAQSFFLAERIAAPNRISIKRISVLLARQPIKINLMRNGVTIRAVADIYEQVYGCGGDLWRLLVK
jgi:membrane peptidoglycan carboxypeptidase